ncbi:MAG: hypothetical protein ABIB71_08250 [Candidatus Woesearchaeota archaeon]
METDNYEILEEYESKLSGAVLDLLEKIAKDSGAEDRYKKRVAAARKNYSDKYEQFLEKQLKASKPDVPVMDRKKEQSGLLKEALEKFDALEETLRGKYAERQIRYDVSSFKFGIKYRNFLLKSKLYYPLFRIHRFFAYTLAQRVFPSILDSFDDQLGGIKSSLVELKNDCKGKYLSLMMVWKGSLLFFKKKVEAFFKRRKEKLLARRKKKLKEAAEKASPEGIGSEATNVENKPEGVNESPSAKASLPANGSVATTKNPFFGRLIGKLFSWRKKKPKEIAEKASPEGVSSEATNVENNPTGPESPSSDVENNSTCPESPEGPADSIDKKD